VGTGNDGLFRAGQREGVVGRVKLISRSEFPWELQLLPVH